MEKIIYPIRINRYLALKNICSRREADGLIAKKIVKINGKIAKLGDKVLETDDVQVDAQKKNKIKKYQYFAYNKPVGIVAHSPEKNQKSVMNMAGLSNDFFPVGRLDKESSGLMILTNDGRLTDKILNPKREHEKEYIVTVNKPIKNMFLNILERGVQLEDFKTKPSKVEKISEQSFSIILTEGKRHQIRRMCAAIGFDVLELKRIRIMGIKLGNLARGQKKEILGEELNKFLKETVYAD